MLERLLICLFITFPFKNVYTQTYSIILGRPTDISVTASVMFDRSQNCFIELGESSGSYTDSTNTTLLAGNTPQEIEIADLKINRQYFYRLRFANPGSNVYLSSPEYTFHTQREKGSTYTFTIEADEHIYDKKGVKSLYDICLSNQLADHPDFMLSLGDIFGDDHYPFTITSSQVDSLHKTYRSLLGKVCHSIPFYVCLGNHEGENDYYYNYNTPENLCVWATKWRKYYYPNPYPNHFYTGNATQEPYDIGYPENYYAWTWGDALFVVLDVYRDQCDTSAKPLKWSWSLGQPQYEWLKATLESSTSKYKFVFAHHILGQGRGGIINATQFEWGGLDNGKDKFSQYRPGWAKPIHKLFVDNKVNIFFQGHDHLFAHELLDGVTYQEVPMPSDSTYNIGMHDNGSAYTADTLNGSGHLRVMVSPVGVKVDFVRAYLPTDTISGEHKNQELAFSYTVGNSFIDTYIFIGNGNWSDTSNWQNNKVPPLLLPATGNIIIDPEVNGVCILDVDQRITSGANITVYPNKKLTINGSLNITQ